MDSQTKSAIKQLVLDLRHTLEDELTIVLRRYGIFTDREWSLEEPPARLTDEADREAWQRIVTVVRQRTKEGRCLSQASQDYVRESAFIFLNRLVGPKCLEVRGIIEEVITTRDIYGGRSKFHRDYRDEHPREARAADDALPACLEAACRQVNQELIGYLFDPDDDHSLVWPQMEGKSDKQKRREHVRRLFSYFALQAVRQDNEGIVPLVGCTGSEPDLMTRVRAQLETLFGPEVAYQLEQEADDYIGRPVEGWLHRFFFHHSHAKLYQRRPILWHISSPSRQFAVMLDYHRLDADTLPKVRSQYLWPALERAKTELRAAGQQDPPDMKTIGDLESFIEDLEACDAALESVIQGVVLSLSKGTVDVDLPDWANGPYRNGHAPYHPDLDDGVKVNILPLQAAGLLPVKKVV